MTEATTSPRTTATVKKYRHSSAITDLEEFEDHRQSLTIDSDWRDVADKKSGPAGQAGPVTVLTVR